MLLRRAGLIAQDASLEAASSSDVALARDITQELGGLPLALDQAGAYIEEIPCNLAEYQALYRTHRTKLLKERRGMVSDHPEPVVTTWSLSFQKVEQQQPAAADLLRFFAYLAPDAVPEEIIVAGAAYLGPLVQPLGEDLLAFHESLAVLGKYSLIHREPDKKTVSVHRLVQAVLKEQMSEQVRRQWAEQTVDAVDAALPAVEHKNWSAWERLLAHALACSELIAHQRLCVVEAAHLLSLTGWYLQERGQYREAEPLYVRALAIREQQLGASHPDTATSLNNLAGLYESQGKYEEAEPLYVRALAICEQELGASHPSTASSLNNLALLYESQGRYPEAEPLYVRALAIYEQELGASHPFTALSLNNLAELYRVQGKYGEAEPLYERALVICEQWLGLEHPHTRIVRDNYAFLLAQMERERTQSG